MQRLEQLIREAWTSVDAVEGETAANEAIRIATALYAACETALDCLIDGSEDDGEAGAALRDAMAEAEGK